MNEIGGTAPIAIPDGFLGSKNSMSNIKHKEMVGQAAKANAEIPENQKGFGEGFSTGESVMIGQPPLLVLYRIF